MAKFPRMAAVEQQFPRPVVSELEAAVRRELLTKILPQRPVKGQSIAIGVGSRGITNLARVVRAAVETLQEQGAQPFILPAMGSHGGGTEAGQTQILAEYGITSEALGVPIDPCLETRQVGETPEGLPVHCARAALAADGVLLINRIKPHTDFHGEVESGLLKMIAIGLGKIEGAVSFHSGTFDYPHAELLRSMARVTLQTGQVLGGIALLENACHETAAVEGIPAERLEAREPELLSQARDLMPSLPVKQADILIIDRIGKNISGVGMDPNITGRYYRINSRRQTEPDITRIIALDLTEETNGNAVGIGLADFCSQRLLAKMDRHSTYLNAIVSRNVICGSIPPNFHTDPELLEHARLSLRAGTTAENVRLLRITDTLNLHRFWASEAMLEELRAHPQVKAVGNAQEMRFSAEGFLL